MFDRHRGTDPPRRGSAVFLRRTNRRLQRIVGRSRSNRCRSKITVGCLTIMYDKLNRRQIPDGNFNGKFWRKRISQIVGSVVLHVS